MPDLKNVPPSPRPRRLSQLKDAWKNKRSVTIVYLLLRASVILVLIAQIFNRNFENVFLCVLTLFLFGVPNMVEHRLDIELPNTLEIIILLFIYAAEILGEINAYYVTFPYWDPQPGGKDRLFALPAVPGHCGILLFHDGWRDLGIF